VSAESSFEYDGPLSTYTEWHALLFGVIVGVPLGWSRTVRREIRKEPHYALGGLLIAAIVSFVIQQNRNN
jgi:hypothetical protein